MRHRKLAVVLGILVLAACSAEGPANNKRDATAAALSLQKSPRKYKAPKFDSNVRVLAQIPIQGVKKDDDCDWSAEFAKAVSGYEAKHPEKEEGRGASLTEWDKDSCAAVVSIVVAKTHENVTPKKVDTLSIQVVGGPVVSPEFELVRRKLRDEDLVLNSDEGPNFGFPGTFSPPQFTAEETCWYYMGLLNYTRNLTSTQDLRTTGLGSKRAQTQVTVYGRTYSYVNPTSLSCVKIDSIKVIKTAYAYHDF